IPLREIELKHKRCVLLVSGAGLADTGGSARDATYHRNYVSRAWRGLGGCLMKPTGLNRFMVLGVILATSAALAAPARLSASEAIVISYKQDLVVATTNPRQKRPTLDSAAVEAACVATALARNLQMAAANSGQAVAMFPALGGVKLANERFLIKSKAGAQACFDPDEDTVGYDSVDFNIAVPDDYTLLIDLVRQFLQADGRMVVCPLCWMSRGYPATDLIDGAEVGTPMTVGPLFLQAEKVIDF
ncbi:hypothetical protein, partial [uncultured Lamprocystis sp.]|uniref:hypothetical protein n=1 Tax=uncultured Lamprocystis sp. TaxID=543132 RepID=UPI0025E1833C